MRLNDISRGHHPIRPPRERAILACVDSRGANHWDTETSIDEFAQPAETVGAVPLARVSQPRPHPDPRSWIGRGKFDEIAAVRDDRRGSLYGWAKMPDDQ